MAKTFNQIFTEAKQKVYSSPSTVLTLLARSNSQVEFSPILAPNGDADASKSTKFNVQRRKRPSVNTVADVKAGTTTAALAALDQFSTVEWDTLPVVTGVVKSVGFKKKFNDDYDFSLNPMHKRDMEYQVGEISVQRHKDLIALLKTAGNTGAALPAHVANDTVVWEAIAAEVDTLAKVDDEFKDISPLQDFVVITTNEVARELTKEMGTAFNQEAPIAQTGFTTGMQINGTPVIIDARLTGRETIIMHKEALGFKSEATKKDFGIDLGLTEFTGTFFYEIMAIIDNARIKKFGA